MWGHLQQNSHKNRSIQDFQRTPTHWNRQLLQRKIKMTIVKCHNQISIMIFLSTSGVTYVWIYIRNTDLSVWCISMSVLYPCLSPIYLYSFLYLYLLIHFLKYVSSCNLHEYICIYISTIFTYVPEWYARAHTHTRAQCGCMYMPISIHRNVCIHIHFVFPQNIGI